MVGAPAAVAGPAFRAAAVVAEFARALHPASAGHRVAVLIAEVLAVHVDRSLAEVALARVPDALHSSAELEPVQVQAGGDRRLRVGPAQDHSVAELVQVRAQADALRSSAVPAQAHSAAVQLALVQADAQAAARDSSVVAELERSAEVEQVQVLAVAGRSLQVGAAQDNSAEGGLVTLAEEARKLAAATVGISAAVTASMAVTGTTLAAATTTTSTPAISTSTMDGMAAGVVGTIIRSEPASQLVPLPV